MTKPSVLVLGRALHSPWNEGTRVISRNFALAAESLRPVRVVSLTQVRFRNAAAGGTSHVVPIEHVYSRRGYGLNGVYLGLPLLTRRLKSSSAASSFGVAHLFSLPLSLAPWLQRQGTRVVAHMMVTPLPLRDRMLVRASIALFGRWIDAFAITSETLAPLLMKWGVPRSKLVILPAAIDVDEFCPGDQAEARKQLGLDPERTLVIYLGRLSPRRFPARVVREALQQAALNTGTPIHFVALTPGQTFDGSANSARYLLECARVVEQDLRNIPRVTVEVRLSNLEDGDKIAWLRAANVVVLPFASPEAVEPPMTLLEAMACGATVIVSPSANRSGLIQAGVTGQVYQEQDELAALLAQTLQAQARGEQDLGVAARQMVIKRHGFQAVAQATAELWKRVEEAARLG